MGRIREQAVEGRVVVGLLGQGYNHQRLPLPARCGVSSRPLSHASVAPFSPLITLQYALSMDCQLPVVRDKGCWTRGLRIVVDRWQWHLHRVVALQSD